MSPDHSSPSPSPSPAASRSVSLFSLCLCLWLAVSVSVLRRSLPCLLTQSLLSAPPAVEIIQIPPQARSQESGRLLQAVIPGVLVYACSLYLLVEPPLRTSLFVTAHCTTSPASDLLLHSFIPSYTNFMKKTCLLASREHCTAISLSAACPIPYLLSFTSCRLQLGGLNYDYDYHYHITISATSGRLHKTISPTSPAGRLQSTISPSGV